MPSWGKAEFKQLRELREKLGKIENIELDKFCDHMSKKLAAMLISLAVKRTPVGVKPELTGEKFVTAVGKSGEKKKFLSAEAARLEQYWGSYTGGTLRRGWTSETEEQAKSGKGSPTASQISEYAKNLSVQKSGGYYIIRIINPVKYASYVEYGHRQTPGRYVPALGKQLKKGWVNGRYMMRYSEADLKKKTPEIVQRELEKFLKEAFGGGEN